MKIVFATDAFWPRVNGVSTSTSTFASIFTNYGDDVWVFAPQYPYYEGHEEEYSYNVIRMKSHLIVLSKEDRSVRATQKLKFFRFMKEIQPDIIHIQTEFMMGHLAYSYARKYDIPFIMHAHTNFEDYIGFYLPFLPTSLTRFYVRKYLKRFFNHAKVIIAPTEEMKDRLLSYKVKPPVRIIPTGINEAEFPLCDKEKERENSFLFPEFPHLKGKNILLYVGRVTREKNMDFLLDMMEKLKRTHPQAHLLIVGDGNYRLSLNKKVAHRGLSDTITFTGYIARDKVCKVYALADIFVFASKTETQGLVSIEAMICKTPVVAIGEMGTRSVMKGNNGGFMVDDDLEQFTEKVLLLLKDKALRQRKEDEAFVYSKNWTASAMAKKVRNLYEEVVANTLE